MDYMTMKSILPAFVLIILALVMASGCVSRQTTECGNLESCFRSALGSCSPATITTLEKLATITNLSTRYSMNATILGKDGDYCAVDIGLEDLEMTGNITELPDRLVYLLVSIYNERMTCRAESNLTLDMDGLKGMLGRCRGGLKDKLAEIYSFEGGGAQDARQITVLENYCVGGEKVVVYIRNTGTEKINLTEELKVLDARTGAEIPVTWKDFSGALKIDELLISAMAQFSLASSAGVRYDYDIVLDGRRYNASVQC